MRVFFFLSLRMLFLEMLYKNRIDHRVCEGLSSKRKEEGISFTGIIILICVLFFSCCCCCSRLLQQSPTFFFLFALLLGCYISLEEPYH